MLKYWEKRERQKLTQQVFANVLGVSKKTVEAGEAGRNAPNGPAQRMLDLMEKEVICLRSMIL